MKFATGSIFDPYAPLKDRKSLADQLRRLRDELLRDNANAPWRGLACPTDLPRAARHSLERLRSGQAVAVVTGQQACLLGGPAYVLYKALGAICLCRWLKSIDIEAVPVFWVASEDHDLGETLGVRRVLTDSRLEKLWHPLYRRHIAAECLAWDKPLGDLLDTHLPDWLQKRWVHAYTRRTRYVEHFIELLLHLTPEDGLLPLEPRDLPGGPFWSGLAGREKSLHEAYSADERQLLEHHLKIQAPRREKIPLFALDPESGERTPLSWDERGWRRGTGLPKSEFHRQPANALREGERLSPGALLRPLFAQAELPVLISLLGPGEWMYHQQLRTAYTALRLPRPVFWPRPGALCLPAELDAWMSEVGLRADRLAGPEAWTPQAGLPPGLDRALDDLGSAIARLEQSALDQFGPSAPRVASGLRRRLDGEIERLRSKLFHEQQAASGISALRLERCRAWCRPRGRLQERVQGGLFLLETEAHWKKIRAAMAPGDPFDTRMRSIIL